MRKFTFLQIASHEFNRSLRIWRKHISPEEIFTLLIRERAKSLAQSIKSSALAAAGAIWLTSSNDHLSVKLPIINSISIPSVFIVLIISLSIGSSIIVFINYYSLNKFVDVASSKLFNFSNSAALSIIKEGDGAWSLGAFSFQMFFKGSTAYNRASKFALSSLLIPYILIILSVYYVILAIGGNIIYESGLFSINGMFAISAWLAAFIPLVIWILFLIPFSFEKNTKLIRWIFLLRIYKRQGADHPRVSHWLRDKK